MGELNRKNIVCYFTVYIKDVEFLSVFLFSPSDVYTLVKFGRSLLNALFRGFVSLMPSRCQFDVCVELTDA